MKKTIIFGASFIAFALLVAFLSAQPFFRPSMNAQAARMTSEAEARLGNLSQYQVFKDLMLMGDKVGDFKTMQIHAVQDDGSLVYEQNFLIDGDTKTYINVWKEKRSKFFHYVEGDKEDTLRYAPNGDLYLDGHKVTAS